MSPSAREPAPFRILVLADFSGRASRGVAEPGPGIAKRKLVRVDRDSFDDAVRVLAPEVRLGAAGTVRFGSLDDFRPEVLAGKVPEAAELSRLRERLFDARSADAAAEEARERFAGAPPPQQRSAAPPRPPAELPADGEGLLGAILESSAPPGGGGGGAWENIVRDVAAEGVEKLRVPRGPADRAALAAAIDRGIGDAVRAALHDPHLRAIEASWRAVDFLVRRLDLGADVQLLLLDVTRDEAFEDVGVSGGFDASGLHRVIVENTVGTEGAPRWSLVAADWAFDAVPRDVAALLRLAKLGRAAGASFVAGASPRIAGCRSLGETPEPEDWREAGDPAGRQLWTALRRLPEAGHAALAWPRFLLRLPYGVRTSAVDGFDFEEFSGPPDHERLLWGNGAFAVTVCLARASESGEAPDPEIDDLPALVAEKDGENALQPSAEAWLRSRGVERAVAQGLVPLVSVQGRAALRLGNLNSLADPPARLAGA